MQVFIGKAPALHFQLTIVEIDGRRHVSAPMSARLAIDALAKLVQLCNPEIISHDPEECPPTP